MSGTLERIEAKLDAMRERVDSMEKKLENRLAEEEPLSVEEIAALTKTHPNTVRKMCESGRYTTARKHGRAWRVSKSEVLGLNNK